MVSSIFLTGKLEITLLSANVYTITGQLQYASGSTVLVTGVKTFSGPITQLQLRMQTGTDTFNAGSINIMYE